VTGAASGIGEACARLLVERGYYVVGLDVRRGLLDIEWHLGSVIEPKHCAAAAELAAPDVVIHCAGVGAGTLELRHSHDMSEEQWQAVLNVNLTGAWNVAKACLSVMDAGSLVFVSSITGQVSAPAGAPNANYAAAKAGVVGMVKALAVEYAPLIRVNAVLPGLTVTPMSNNLKRLRPELYAEFAARHPLGALDVRDVASMCVNVAENEALTGASVVVDGGYTAG
jgi:NAD(P)-dependent dehydrogenase (short-subunit alcohol dehydrogenase family)